MDFQGCFEIRDKLIAEANEADVNDTLSDLAEKVNEMPSVLQEYGKCVLQNYNIIKKEVEKINDHKLNINFIAQFLEKESKIPDITTVEKKSNTQAEQYRKDGNEKCKNREFLDAVKLYTKSIAHAETKSEMLALAYGNRSAVLFVKKYYAECLTDIERALDNNYPESLKHKLLQRKKEAMSLLPKQKKIEFHEKLPEVKKNNSKIQCADDCVEFKENELIGKHIVATRDIKVGEVFAVEKLYAVSVSEIAELIYCHECLERCYNLLPCTDCKKALYCSEFCLVKAFETYHKYECKLRQLNVDGFILPLKISLKGYVEFENAPKTEEKNDVYRSDRYKEIGEVVKVFPGDKMNIEIICAMYFNLFKKVMNISETKAQVLNELMSDNYSWQLRQAKVRAISLETEGCVLLGNGVLSFLRHVNNSCKPTMDINYYGSYAVARSVRNVKKGQQMALSYWKSYYSAPHASRKSYLQKMFYFNCTCEACVQDWPDFPFLKDVSELSYVYALYLMPFVKPLRDYDFKNLDKIVEEISMIMSAVERHEPCRELVFILFYLQNLYFLTANKDIPF